MLSIWEKESFYKPVDIIIAGSGLMGLWAAYELKSRAPGLEVLILDKNNVPTGASTRNGGFACLGSPTELLRNSETMGTAAMLDIVGARNRGILKIRHVLGDAAVAFDACGGYECITKDYKYFHQLKGKLEWLNALLETVTGHRTTFIENTTDLANFGLTGFNTIIENKFEGALHSGMLMQSLMQLVKEKGVQIMMGEEVKGWQQNQEDLALFTTNHQFKTQKLIVATNGFTNSLLPALNVEPARGQVIVTRPIEGLKLRGTFHYNEGFYYWRHLENRVLLGGARNMAMDEERTDNLQVSETIQAELERFLMEHILKDYALPAGGLIENRWAGLMGFTEDKKPQVTRVENHVWAAISCNGMGVALTPIIAEQLATAVLA
ncbi:MAG: FAD-binding oxidoreductase [Chitinophagaceae bacterium]